jgi:hypothetical protein
LQGYPRRRAGPPEPAPRQVEEGIVGFVSVKTDYRARATTFRFSSRET